MQNTLNGIGTEEEHSNGQIIIAFIIAIALIAGYAVFGPILPKTNDQNSFTGLYFTDYNKEITNGTANFGIAIENHEAKETTYYVEVSFDSDIVKLIPITLAKDQNYFNKFSLPFNLPAYTEHAVKISLKNRPESISFQTSVKKDYPATFGEKNIAIIGYIASPQAPKTGTDFNITYEWKCLFPTDKNYMVFVHFFNEKGELLFQNDHWPAKIDANGQQKEYLTTECIPSDIFTEKYSLKAVQKGIYNIKIGFYLPPAHRLKVDNDIPENYYLLGTIKVT